jgi:type 1 glutamine amidotransferase
MRFFNFLILGFLIGSISIGCGTKEETTTVIYEGAEHAILVFTKTSGWRHDSIKPGREALKEIARKNGYSITLTEDSDYFTFENLSQYDAVIFLNTSETIFEDNQRVAFEEYIRGGGGFVGTHSASDTEYDWPWYGELVGAWFDNHPNFPNVREAEVLLVDSRHPSTFMLPESWVRADEWYNFGYMNENVTVLLELNTDSYEGSDHPGNHPIAWYHEFDGGRSFYTAMGHTKESFSEELFLVHLEGGLKYAMGIE